MLLTGGRQSVPKLPGFRWLYHQEAKHLQRALPLPTCTKSWATVACESTMTLYCPSPTPTPSSPMVSRCGISFLRFCDMNPRSRLRRSAFWLNSSTTTTITSSTCQTKTCLTAVDKLAGSSVGLCSDFQSHTVCCSTAVGQ